MTLFQGFLTFSNSSAGKNLDQESLSKMLEMLFKDFFILGAIIYIVFAVVIVRQIAVMKKTISTSFSPVIQTLGYIHLAAAIGVLLFFISIL